MEAELEKDLEDDVIPVPSETDDLDDDDPELNALTKIAERNSTQVCDFFSYKLDKVPSEDNPLL